MSFLRIWCIFWVEEEGSIIGCCRGGVRFVFFLMIAPSQPQLSLFFFLQNFQIILRQNSKHELILKIILFFLSVLSHLTRLTRLLNI